MKKLNCYLIFTILIVVTCGLLSSCINKENGNNTYVEAVVEDKVIDYKDTENDIVKENDKDKETEITFIDDLGREVIVNQPKKVAAFMGSYAELWLLAGGTLSAVTEDAYDERGLSLEDSIVNLGRMNSPDMELLVEADIDFVLLSSKVSEHIELMDNLDKLGINYAYFEVETFNDYLSMLKVCTDITGVKEYYEINGLNLKDGIEDVINNVPKDVNPTVLFLRAFSTGVKAKGSDSMAGIMLKELGCVNIADSDDSLLEDLNMEKIVSEDPDYVFVVTMGSSEEKALEAINELLTSHPAWNELTAIKEGRYYILPKNLFHLKPNARWKESYDMLYEILYEKQ